MPLPPYQARSTVPALVVLLGLAASLFTYSVVRNAEDAADEARFGDRAQQAAQRLHDALVDETAVLRRLGDLYSVATPPDDGLLTAFTQGLFNGPDRDPV